MTNSRAGPVSLAKTLSTVENALTLQCEANVEHAARIEFGRVATTRQLKQQPAIQADIYIRTESECMK
jgi:hypothetical protein